MCIGFHTASWSALLVTLTGAVVSLPFGDINVLIVTDVHSWVAGHMHEPQYNANYGDVLSLQHYIKEDCIRNKRDLFFIMNGDINDGTGYSADPPEQLVPLLEKLPWDAVTVGNHELYKNDFVNYIGRKFIPFWGDRYLTANVMNATTGQPLGRTHKFLRGQFGAVVLAFGFLYNMPDHDTAVEVVEVEKVVQQQWFQNVLSGAEGNFDAILILGHMDHADHLVTVILRSIRKLRPDVPVQFVTGHSHIRAYTPLDNAACSFEAGHYLDTVGFASFPKQRNVSSDTASFQHVFIDANVDKFKALVGLQSGDRFLTEEGAALTEQIERAGRSMGLSQVFGCAPRTYRNGVAFNQTDSLMRLCMNEVVSRTLFRQNTSKVFVVSKGSLRYDLFEGHVTKNDIVTMTPFADKFWLLGERVQGSLVSSVLRMRPGFASTPFDEQGIVELYGGSFDVGSLDRPGDLLKTLLSLTNGTTTVEERFPGKTTTSLWYDFVSSAWPCKKEAAAPATVHV